MAFENEEKLKLYDLNNTKNGGGILWNILESYNHPNHTQMNTKFIVKYEIYIFNSYLLRWECNMNFIFIWCRSPNIFIQSLFKSWKQSTPSSQDDVFIKMRASFFRACLNAVNDCFSNAHFIYSNIRRS